MSLIEIHDSETRWISTLATANEIHDLLDQGCDPQRVREMLRARFKISLPATSGVLASYSSPFTHHLVVFALALPHAEPAVWQ